MILVTVEININMDEYYSLNIYIYYYNNIISYLIWLTLTFLLLINQFNNVIV